MVGRHSCTPTMQLAARIRDVACPICQVQPGFPCTVANGPYAGRDAMFHEARVSMGRASMLTTEGTT